MCECTCGGGRRSFDASKRRLWCARALCKHGANSGGPLGTAIGGRKSAICQDFYEGIEAVDWGEMHEHSKEVSKRIGVKQDKELLA